MLSHSSILLNTSQYIVSNCVLQTRRRRAATAGKAAALQFAMSRRTLFGKQAPLSDQIATHATTMTRDACHFQHEGSRSPPVHLGCIYTVPKAQRGRCTHRTSRPGPPSSVGVQTALQYRPLCSPDRPGGRALTILRTALVVMAARWLQAARDRATAALTDLQALADEPPSGMPTAFAQAAVERCRPRAEEAVRVLQAAQAGGAFTSEPEVALPLSEEQLKAVSPALDAIVEVSQQHCALRAEPAAFVRQRASTVVRRRVITSGCPASGSTSH